MILRGTVADIADQVEAAGLRQAAVILVGEALGARADPRAGESHLYDPQRDRSASLRSARGFVNAHWVTARAGVQPVNDPTGAACST